MEHRLAAVVMADVVGYSRLMEADEAGTLAAWKERRTSILEPTVRAHGGRIVKLMGDGVLIEFGSAMHAVAGALELQRKMTEANSSLTDARRIVLRMGINLGDVLGEAGDIYGEGVNIAARLEALAEPGGICISAKVHEEVRGKLAFIFEDTGEQTLKNIARPIRVYRLHAGAEIEATSPQPPDLSLPDRPSIAVLPFQNMSGDSEQEYFADGMVEDITTAMSRLRWLFVIARNSSFTYKGRAVDVKQVGRELGVRYVLEGSVRKAGTRVRVTGQLIDTSTGAHLWADRFDGELANIFDLQDQVTASVVGAIAPKLEQAEIERAERKPTQSLDAYDYFLRGMAAFHKFTQASNETALELFYRAIELDPRFAAAYGMAARCYLQRKGFGWVADRDREIAETRRLAGQAAELGRDDAVALSAAGMALIVVAGDLDEGADLVERALVLNPNLAWAAHFSALTKAFLGEPGPAIEHAARAMRLSPQDPQMFAMQSATALAHFIAGRYDEASSWAEAALRQRSNFLMALGIAAASGVLAGKTEQAQKAMARLRELNPALRISNVKTWVPFRRPEDFSRWAEGLAKAGLAE
jgi:TolB-like protein/class 3 adenylate cyclase